MTIKRVKHPPGFKPELVTLRRSTDLRDEKEKGERKCFKRSVVNFL